MIFPSEDVLALRRGIDADVHAGRISPEDGFRQLLQADPDDILALRFFAKSALKRNQLAECEQYARHLVRADPSHYLGYDLLAEALEKAGSPTPRVQAYRQLAWENLPYDKDAFDQVDIEAAAEHYGLAANVTGLSREDALARISDALKEYRAVEPAEVAKELEPHRLIARLFDSWDTLLDRDVVDAILRNAEDCAPLLLGILNEWSEELLAEEDETVVERALALLGEIGDPAFLPAFAAFLVQPEDNLSGPADWAFRRVSFRYPEGAVDQIRRMVAGAPGETRLLLADQIVQMPDAPGRCDVLASLVEGIGGLPRKQQEAVVVAVTGAGLMLQGAHSVLADTLEKQCAGLLSAKARADLRRFRRDAVQGPYVAQPTDFSIHEICCEYPDPDEEPTQVINAPMPGRNDPCWCGSGRKYKKCHLEQDERR